ncbi:MAG: helix-turn-helix domain-containing protein [bacterium]|nr:helix-turn-helix domain-containing protein [bacterium]
MANKKFEMKEMNAGLIDVYIGKRLKLRRIMLHMSQDELASMVGVTFQQIQKYESGNTKLSASRLLILAKVLQVDIQYFYDGLEKEVPGIDEFEASVGYVSEKVIEFDPMRDNETLELVNSYWKLQNPEKRKKILDFIVSMI